VDTFYRDSIAAAFKAEVTLGDCSTDMHSDMGDVDISVMDKVEPLLGNIESGVAQHLRHVESDPLSVISEDIETDTDKEVIDDTRDAVFRKALVRMHSILHKDNSDYIAPTLTDIMYLKERKGAKAYFKKAQDIVELLLYAAELKDTLPKESVGIKKHKSWPKELEITSGDHGSDAYKVRLLKMDQQLADHSAMINDQRQEIASLQKQLIDTIREITDIKTTLAKAQSADKSVSQNTTSSPVNHHRPGLSFDEASEDTINSTVVLRLGQSLASTHQREDSEETIGGEHDTNEDTQFEQEMNNIVMAGNQVRDRNTQNGQVTSKTVMVGNQVGDVNTTPPAKHYQGDHQGRETQNKQNKCTLPTLHKHCTEAVAKALHGDASSRRNPAHNQGDATPVQRTINNSLAEGSTGAPKQNENIIGRTINNSLAEGTRASSQDCSLDQSYKEALTQHAGPWNTPSSKRNNPSKKPSSKALRGQRQVKSWILYVNNIWVEPGYNPRDVTQSLRSYCANANVHVLHAEVLSNRRREDTVGCKLTVSKNQASMLKEQHFWPTYITCRDWSFNQKTDRFKGRRLLVWWHKINIWR
jgi:hypothetical protein